jgi:predicted flap endonuclease-1-like 5' DNA nuclease
MEADMLAIQFLSEGGPDTSLTPVLLVLFGFFLLMVIIGWLSSKNKPTQPEVRQEVHEHGHDQGDNHAHEEKMADDLIVLEGIGPKVARVLNAAGFVSFADLANADPAEVQKTLDAAGLQMMNPAGWIEQAKLAAAGDKEGLAKLQAELKGGRRK